MTTLGRIFFAGSALVLVGAMNYCGPTTMGFTGVPDLAQGGPDLAPSGLTLSQVSPSIAPNTGGTNLTLTGSGFLSGATVTIGGIPATGVVVLSATQLTCTLPAQPRTCGPAGIVVTNPGNQMVTAASLFTYKSSGFGLMAALSTAAGSLPAAGNVVAGDGNAN